MRQHVNNQAGTSISEGIIAIFSDLARGLRPALLVLALVCLLAGLGACGKGGEPAATQSAGTGPGKGGPRIVSAVPAATLQLVQLGAAESLAGVTAYDKMVLPEAQQNLPVVGDYLNFNYETLLAARPTAVVVQMADERLAPRLRDICTGRGIGLVNVRLDTVEDLFATARRLGDLSGRRGAAEARIGLIKAQLGALEEKLAGRKRPKVIYVIGRNPIWVVGGHRFMDEMITRAGGENLGAQVAVDFPEVTNEMLVRLAPEVILVAHPGEPVPTEPDDPRFAAWAALPTPASRAGRIFLMTNPTGQLASLELAENTLELARAIHPELRDWQLPKTFPAVPATAPASMPATAPKASEPAAGGAR